QVIEPVLDQFQRDGQAIQFFTNPLVSSNIRAKPIAAVEDVSTKQRIAFALEEQIFRKFQDFVFVFGEPAFEVDFFALSFLVSEIGAKKTIADNQAGVGHEDHVG